MLYRKGTVVVDVLPLMGVGVRLHVRLCVSSLCRLRVGSVLIGYMDYNFPWNSTGYHHALFHPCDHRAGCCWFLISVRAF